MTLDPALAALLIACLTLLFASAAFHKLRDLQRFEEVFTAYGLIPGRARWRLAPIVPALEGFVAAGLLFTPSRRAAVGIAVALLLGYAMAIAINLARGRRDLTCGCGGPNDRRPIAAWMVWRNLCLTLLAVALLAPWASRQLGMTDLVTIACGAAGCSLIYLCMDALLSHAGRGSARVQMS